MSYEQYQRACMEAFVLTIAAMVSVISSWWVFAAAFAALWLRNIVSPPERRKRG